MKKLIFALTLVVTTCLYLSPVWAGKKLLLKTPSAYKSTLPGLGSPVARLAKQLKLMSGGTLRMKFYEPGKLVEPFEILDTVSAGKVNSGYATAGYWAGKMPAASLFSSVPFGPETGEYLAWMYYGNGHTANACTVSFTSCTRITCAPLAAHKTAPLTLPAMRSDA